VIAFVIEGLAWKIEHEHENENENENEPV